VNKILFILLLLVSASYAEVINQYPTQALLDSKIKIIDIRTPGEWKDTGLLEGAIPITFFNERGKFDLMAFLGELRLHVQEGEEFAIICHVGSRTEILADFLSKTYNMKVVNLLGGMAYAQTIKLPIHQYIY